MIPRKLARKFAYLYLSGEPPLKGDWHAVSQFLGFPYPPPVDEPTLVAAIEARGGHAPRMIPAETPATHDPAEGQWEDDGGPAFEQVAEEPPEARDPADWKMMADKLRPIMAQVAATGGYVITIEGERTFVKATAAQVAALKVIFDRAEGRVAEKATAKAAPVGVVVLPSDGFVCPRCGFNGDL